MTLIKFGTLFNCIDGRVHLVAINWMCEKEGLDYVDMITEPGIDNVISNGDGELVNSLRVKARGSIEAHNSSVIAVVGHHDCAANPGTKRKHLSQIRESMDVIRTWNLPVRIVGLWIGEKWQVEEVFSGYTAFQ